MEFMFFKFFQNSEHLDQNENTEKTSNVLMQTTAARKYYIIWYIMIMMFIERVKLGPCHKSPLCSLDDFNI